MVEFFVNGGSFMWPILATLIIGLAFIGDRLYHLIRALQTNFDFAVYFSSIFDKKGFEVAKKVCDNAEGPIANLCYNALEVADQGADTVEKKLSQTAGIELASLEKNMTWISLCIATAPMLGFLGTIAGMIVALMGTVFVLLDDFDLSSKYTLGNFYALLCSLCIGLSLLIAERVRNNEGTIEYTRMLYGVAALTIFSIGSFYTDSFIILENTEILGFIFLAVFPTILGHNIFYYSLKFTTPTIVSSVPLGEPIFASIIAFFLFHEIITTNVALGGLLCICGIYIILKNRSV